MIHQRCCRRALTPCLPYHVSSTGQSRVWTCPSTRQERTFQRELRCHLDSYRCRCCLEPSANAFFVASHFACRISSADDDEHAAIRCLPVVPRWHHCRSRPAVTHQGRSSRSHRSRWTAVGCGIGRWSGRCWRSNCEFYDHAEIQRLMVS